MKHYFYYFICCIFLYTSCSESNQNDTTSVEPSVKKDVPRTLLTPILQAHGSAKSWQSIRSFFFDLPKNEEHYQVDLWTRKSLITTPKFKIGSNGEKVWLLQDSTTFKSDPRFYHNLMFYFVAMPFVLADPGIIYEKVPDLEVDSQAYTGIKVSYEANIGDAAKDNYIVYYDKETKEMTYLAYTVTYFSDEVSTDYRLIKYTFDKIGGFKLPTQMQWFNYKDGQVGEPRGEPMSIENIDLSTAALDSTIFSIPEGATLH